MSSIGERVRAIEVKLEHVGSVLDGVSAKVDRIYDRGVRDKGAAGARGRIFSLWHAAILTAAAVVSGAAGAVTAMAAIAHRVASVVPKI